MRAGSLSRNKMAAPGGLDMMECKVTIKDAHLNQRDVKPMRPWLANPDFWKHCRERGKSFEIDPTTEFESRNINTPQNVSEEDKRRQFRFLDLPTEIRMHIYHWLHLMSPVRHAQLAPWYPIPVYSHSITSPITERSIHALEQEYSEEGAPSPERQRELDDMLSPFRPLSSLPSNLLRASSKIYFEARALPFETNEFVFVNWFASGLWAAKAFNTKLCAWQRARVRYVRLEVMFRDFTDQGYEAWIKLCEAWADSVKGLRLKIIFTSCGRELWAERAKQLVKYIGAGVERMGSLERLELELSTEDMHDMAKVGVCKGLEEGLREKGLRGAGRGVAVIATRDVKVWTKQTKDGETLGPSEMPNLPINYTAAFA